MIPFFPKQISSKGFYLYLGALAAVSLVFFSYAMGLEFIAMGIIWTSLFFFGSTFFTERWRDIDAKKFVKYVFWTALGLRVAWVIFSYLFFIAKTGIPFEFSAADSMGYYEDSAWLATEKWKTIRSYLDYKGISDAGYIFYLTYLYKLIGPNIFITRLIKSVISAYTCILLYKLATRSMNENVGRMTAIFAMLFPNLIMYCGLHLKETEMIFLSVAFLERADYLIRSKKYNVFTIALPLLLALSLFTFRTVMGAVALFSFATAVVFTTTPTMGKAKRWVLIGWGLLAITVFAGGTIVNEIEGVWQNRDINQESKRAAQTARGNKWAKYATGTVMAPMMFVLPFPTMVDVDEQYNQQMMSGGNFARNFLGCFVIIAIFNALFKKKNWRDLSLLGSFVIGYLGVVSASGFSNSERFLLPGLPVLLIMAAYGISLLDAKSFKFVKIWYWVVPIMAVAWAYFKLGSRGLF